MKLDNQTKRLIAVGASVSANCQPCLQINITKALEEGIQGEDIEEAIQVGRLVRQGAASKMDKFASSLEQLVPMPAAASDGGCGCKE
jgi:AhpD family alkylhydroperoxidase